MRTNHTCFLIDNDPDDCAIFLMALQEIDPAFSCTIANNGIEALNKISNDPAFLPSAIFIDVNMPMMNGKQCLQELRKIEKLDNVPVYVYSTFSDPRSIEDIKAMGAKDFFTKPSSFTSLVELLSRLLQCQKSLQ